MKKIFIDNDILLDFFLAKEEFIEETEELFDLIENKSLKAYISMTSFTNFYYIISKHKSKKSAKNFLKLLLKFVTTVDTKAEFAEKSLNDSHFKDLEDSLQHLSALLAKADLIITRNLKDYTHSKIPVMTAKDFLRTL